MKLSEIKTTVKNQEEQFLFNGKPLDYKLLDFWAWNQSDLIENRNRGLLAEFIIRQALGLRCISRLEWNDFDLVDDNIKIEVKSAAYIQAWPQEKFSSISFKINPSRRVLDDNNLSENAERHADIYIFCLLHHKDQDTIDPLNLDQWTFYLVKTETLNRNVPNQKSIVISTIEMFDHEKCSYGEINEAYGKLKRDITANKK